MFNGIKPSRMRESNMVNKNKRGCEHRITDYFLLSGMSLRPAAFKRLNA